MGVKAIVQFYPTLPAPPGRRGEGRPLGRDRASYQKVLRDWARIARAAEDFGFWGISSIEHHFHSEGYEVAPSPGVINAWLGAHTTRINIGTNGYPLGTHDAIRVAEETAVLDHLLEGRFWTGFSRGYQSRWTDVMGQYHGARATSSDGGAADRRNREVFEEQVEIVLRSWTEDAWSMNGRFSQAPFPYSGIEGYQAADTTALYGAPGEVDDEGRLVKVSVGPAPYTRPHPPVMVASSSSDESIRYCARMGFITAHFSPLAKTRHFARIYQEEAAAAGHPLPLGANQAPVRWPHIASSPADYDRQLAEYDADIFENFYAKFFTHKMPMGVDVVESIKASGLYLGGTVDQAKAAFEAEWEAVPSEYSILIWHWAQQPTDDIIREMEALATHVYPAIGGMEPPEAKPLAQWTHERPGRPGGPAEMGLPSAGAVPAAAAAVAGR